MQRIPSLLQTCPRLMLGLFLIACGPGDTKRPGDPGDDRGEGGDGADGSDSGAPCNGEAYNTYYVDLDGDGYGDETRPVEACELLDGLSEVAGDCDDQDPDRHPGTAWYGDRDGDGYGDPELVTIQCDQPDDHVANNLDCDDMARFTNPSTPWYADLDGDGYGDAENAVHQCEQPEGTVPSAGDCDDTNAAIHPSADEYCGEIDYDCDGMTNEFYSIDATQYYWDEDGDGWGSDSHHTRGCTPPGGYWVDRSGDCHETNGRAYPGSHWTETPNDGIDQDCDGYDYCRDLNCDSFADIVFAGWRRNGSTYTVDSYLYYGSATGYTWYNRTGISTTAAFAAEVEDFDLDGYLDVVFASFNPEDYSQPSEVFWGSVLGHSSADHTTLPTAGARAVCKGDFNADGYPDLAFASYYSGSSFVSDSAVYYGSSTGLSTAASSLLSTVGAFDCAVSDLDLDGFDDLVIVSNTLDSTDPSTRYSTESYIFWGSSTGLSDADSTTLSTYGSRRILIEDVDLDGWEDLVVPTLYMNEGVTTHSEDARSIVFYNASGVFTDTNALELSAWAAQAAAAGDLNGDGYQDLALASYRDSSSHTLDSPVFYGSAAGLSSTVGGSIETHGANWITIQDLDADGYDDIVSSNYRDDDTVAVDSYVYFGSASGIDSTTRIALPTSGTRRHAIADLNEDGWKDIVFSNYIDTSGTNLVNSYIYYGSASGYSVADMDEVPNFGARWLPIVVGAEIP